MSEIKNLKNTKKIKENLGLDSTSSETWFYYHAKSYKFQCHIRPTIQTYYDVYIKLAKGEEIDKNLFSDIILIGLNLKDYEEDYVFEVSTLSTEKFKAVPSKEIYITTTYSQDFLLNYAKEKGVQVLIPPEKESDFRYYMEVSCSVLMQLMFLNSKNINYKLNHIKKGMEFLSVLYTGEEKYINFKYSFRKAIRNVARDHPWKPIISVILIKNYVKYTQSKNKNVKTFIEWQIMFDTFLYGFGIIRLMTKFIEITQCTIDEFLNLCYCDSIKREFEKTIKPLKKIITHPTETNLEEWFFYRWSGLINKSYTKGFDLEFYPGLTSMMLGFFNSCLSPEDYPIIFEEFPTKKYNVKYYDWGLRLLKYIKKIPVTNIINTARQISKEIEKEVLKDQINIFTFLIYRTHEKLIFKKEEKTCGVCLEEINSKTKKKFGLIKNCKHIFCFDCINMWVNQSFNETCPECRTPIGSIKASLKYIEKEEEKKKFFETSSNPTYTRTSESRISNPTNTRTSESRILNPTNTRISASRISNPTNTRTSASRSSNPTNTRISASRILNPTNTRTSASRSSNPTNTRISASRILNPTNTRTSESRISNPTNTRTSESRISNPTNTRTSESGIFNAAFGLWF